MEDTSGENKNNVTRSRIKRRDILKGMASLPVFGLFGYKYSQSRKVPEDESVNMIHELGLNQELKFNIPGGTSTKPADTIRLGVIGAGSRSRTLLFQTGFAPKIQIDGMDKTAKDNWMSYRDLNVVLTGVCEVFDERAERAIDASRNSVKAIAGETNLPKVKRYKHYHDLLSSDEIDAVIIATPDHWHAQMSIDAISAGKHVYCEKAPTRTEEEAFRMAAALKNSKEIYQLGHQVRHNPIYPYAADLVKKGVLGNVNLVEMTTNRNTSDGAWVRHLNDDGSPRSGDPKSIDWDLWLGDRPKVPFSIDRYYNWTKYFDYATGLLGQLFSHEFDAINGILNCGIPASCMCTGGIYYYDDGREIPDLMQAVFEYPNKGMTLIYSATLANSRSRGRVIMGRDASMEIGSSLSVIADGNSTKYKDKLDKRLISNNKPMFTIGPNQGTDAVSSATEKYYADRGLTTVNIGGESKDITHLHLREWLDVIRNGGNTSCNIDWAFQEAIAIQMAKKSYFEKRQVRWDAENQKIV
ncbi:Gfo/Idh/MocA family protein [Bacteroidota bacterium]